MIDASAESLVPFVEDSVKRGSIIQTDGWAGYTPLEGKGYDHEVTVVKRSKKTASELLPRVHLVISLLRRWLLGTHQGDGQSEAPRLLSGRVHVPLQSATIKEPWQALLSPRTASYGD